MMKRRRDRGRTSGTRGPTPDVGAVQLSLFGALEARAGGQAIELTIRKTAGLIAFVALEGRTARSRLSALFWPDVDEDAARRNLRRELFRLREAGLGVALDVDDEAVDLRDLECDVSRFEAAIEAGEVEAACVLYRSALLDGFSLPGCEEFNDWLETRRAACARQWRAALARRAAELEASGALREALAAHYRLLADDAFQETHYRHVMSIHQQLGERALALAQFERCRSVLHTELGLAPMAETARLAERIRRDEPVAGPTAAASSAMAPAKPGRLGVGPLVAPLVGRAAMLARFDEVDAPVVLLTGEPGIGKTRLLEAAAARTAGTVVPMRCNALSTETALYPVVQALRAQWARAPSAFDQLAPTWRRELGRLIPELAAGGDRKSAARIPDAQDRLRFIEVLARTLTHLAGSQGLILVDDLQWADATTLEVLGQLARERADGSGQTPRVWVAARPLDPQEHPAATRFAAEIRRAGLVAELTLPPLAEGEVRELVQRLSGAAGGERFAARLASATGGNPYYLLETIRFLFERDEIALDPQGGWRTRYDDTTTDYSELAVPPTVRAAVLDRLDRLGPGVIRLLEAAALDDGDFQLEDAAGASALTDWESVVAIESALRAQLVERDGAAYRFAHDLVRAALTSQMGPERSRLIHRLLARAQIGRRAAPARIAVHLRASGARIEAAEWSQKAAAEALARFAYEDVLRLADIAVADGAAGVAVEAHELRALALRALGRHDEFARELDALEARMAGPGDRKRRRRARRMRSLYFSDTGQVAQSYAIDCQLMAEGFEDRAEEAEILRGAGFAALFLGREAEAAELLSRALPLAEEFRPDHASPTWAVYAMAQLLLGDADAAEVSIQRALELASVEDPLQRADALNYGSGVAEARGDHAAKLARIREACGIADSTGNLPRRAAFLANEIVFLSNDGVADEARRAHERLVDLIGARVSPLARYMVASTGARVAYAAGDLGTALTLGAAAQQHARDSSVSANQVAIALLMAQWHLALGNTDEAAKQATEAAAVDAAGTRLLAAEAVIAACALAAGRSGECVERLQAAFAGSQRGDHDRYKHRDFAACVLGAGWLASGEPDKAVSAVSVVRFSPGLRAQALAIGVCAASRLRDAAATTPIAAEAGELLASGRLAPLDALALLEAQRSLARANGDAAGERAASDQAARLLAALITSLSEHPVAASALRRRYSDLRP